MATATKGKGGNYDSRPNPFNSKKNGSIAPELAEVPLLASVLDKVLKSGCACMLGHTRDGGAVVLTILDGDNRHRTYCANTAELEDAFSVLNDMYDEP